MDKFYKKVEGYLAKQFPGKSPIRVKRVDKDFDIYGFMGVEIRVMQSKGGIPFIYYQLMTK